MSGRQLVMKRPDFSGLASRHWRDAIRKFRAVGFWLNTLFCRGLRHNSAIINNRVFVPQAHMKWSFR